VVSDTHSAAGKAGRVIYPWLEAANAEFAERFADDRLPHAVLLSGPMDTGKTDLATGFIASVLCLENQHPACGTCRSCQLLKSGAHPDRHTITFENHPRKPGEFRKELVIDQIRRLITSLSLTNTISRRKATLIHPVDALTISAANGLLKTLEEPRGETVLILVAHNTGRLPATIRSRCQNLVVRPSGSKGAIDWLCAAANIGPDEAESALQAAAGSPLKAARMIKDGSIEQHQKVRQVLDDLRSARINPGSAVGVLAEIDPELLWSWISLLAADAVKVGIDLRPDAARLSRLQSLADRNRRLLPTPVRKDFLLQDWLIQWARIGA
jgi:DNA polymerase-3 subunit delta'